MAFDLRPKQNRNFISHVKNTDDEDDFNDSEKKYQYENHAKNEQDLPNSAGKILYQWRGPEFEVYEKSKTWYFFASVFILAVVAYALYENSPLMAITFILTGIVGFIYSQKDPRVVTFFITSKGVLADKEMYIYDNIISFWIFYEPGHTKILSLHTKASTFPFVHIPLGDEDPVKIREIILEYVDEIKQDPSLIDTIEKVLHL